MPLWSNKFATIYVGREISQGNQDFVTKAVIAEMARSVATLQKRRKALETKETFEKELAQAQSNLDFVVRLGLVEQEKAEEYRLLLVKVRRDFDEAVRKETIQREATAQKQRMEFYGTRIAEERTKAEGQRGVREREYANEREEHNKG